MNEPWGNTMNVLKYPKNDEICLHQSLEMFKIW